MRILNYLCIFCTAVILHIFVVADDELTVYTTSGVTSGIEKKELLHGMIYCMLSRLLVN